MESWFRAFPDTRWELKSLMSSGDTFVAEGIFRGTHNGPMDMGDAELPATGKRRGIAHVLHREGFGKRDDCRRPDLPQWGYVDGAARGQLKAGVGLHPFSE